MIWLLSLNDLKKCYMFYSIEIQNSFKDLDTLLKTSVRI